MFPQTTQFQAWTSVADQWLDVLAETLDGLYFLDASKHFLLMAPDTGPHAPRLLNAAERCHDALIATLRNVANFDIPGKLPILILDSAETYYQYIAPFYPEGNPWLVHGNSNSRRLSAYCHDSYGLSFVGTNVGP